MTNEFQLPSNSQSNRVRPEESSPRVDEEPKLEKITTGKVVRQKKSLRKKFSQVFFNGDPRSAFEYVLHDVIVPAIKEAVVDSFDNGVRIIMGVDRKSSRRRFESGSSGRFDYRAKSSRSSVWDTREREIERPRIAQKSRASHDFDEILLETRVEAEEVLENLFELVEKYGQARVSDLYDLVGLTAHYTDRSFGWTDLRGSGITKTRGEYMLDLPKPESLD